MSLHGKYFTQLFEALEGEIPDTFYTRVAHRDGEWFEFRAHDANGEVSDILAARDVKTLARMVSDKYGADAGRAMIAGGLR